MLRRPVAGARGSHEHLQSQAPLIAIAITGAECNRQAMRPKDRSAPMSASHRTFLLGGVGLATLASLALAAPASAQDRADPDQRLSDPRRAAALFGAGQGVDLRSARRPHAALAR